VALGEGGGAAVDIFVDPVEHGGTEAVTPNWN
jgi:hypothetical protein